MMTRQTRLLASLGVAISLGIGCAEPALDDEEFDSFLEGDAKEDSFGVVDGSYEAMAILEMHSTLSNGALRSAGISAAAANAVVKRRSALGGRFATLKELDAVSFTGKKFFEKSLAYVVGNDLVGYCGDHIVQPGLEPCDLGTDDADDGCSDACQWEHLGWYPDRQLAGARFAYGDHLGTSGAVLQRWRYTVSEPTQLGLDLGADWWKPVQGDYNEWLSRFATSHYGTYRSTWIGAVQLRVDDEQEGTEVDPHVDVDPTVADLDSEWDRVIDLEPGTHIIEVYVQSYIESGVAYSLFAQPL